MAQGQYKDGTVEDLRVSDDTEITQPMVCIVNSGTAGGAELFANTLRKMGGATLVGTTTAGKGVVLSDPQSLSDGSAIVITRGLILDNEGQNWNGTGLTPDIHAAPSADEASSYYDFTVDTDPQITLCRQRSTGVDRCSDPGVCNRIQAVRRPEGKRIPCPECAYKNAVNRVRKTRRSVRRVLPPWRGSAPASKQQDFPSTTTGGGPCACIDRPFHHPQPVRPVRVFSVQGIRTELRHQSRGLPPHCRVLQGSGRSGACWRLAPASVY